MSFTDTNASRCFAPHYTPLDDGRPIGHGNFSSVEAVRPTATSIATAVGDSVPTMAAAKCCATVNQERLRVMRAEWETYQQIRETIGQTRLAPGAVDFSAAASKWGIIGCYGYHESADEAALVLEHAPHGDLMRLVATRRAEAAGSAVQVVSVVTEAEIHGVMKQLLTALDATHTAGLVHRDVKPHNLLVTSVSPLQVKLADFGLAKRVGATNLWARQNSAGDYDYMPTEVRERVQQGSPMRRRDYFRSDVYAAGVTMFYLVAGSLPRPAELAELQMPEVRMAHWPHVSPACLEFLAQLLIDNEDHRPMPADALVLPWLVAPAPAAAAAAPVPAPTSTTNHEAITTQDPMGEPSLSDGGRTATGTMSQRGVSVTHSDLLEDDFRTACAPQAPRSSSESGEEDGSDTELVA